MIIGLQQCLKFDEVVIIPSKYYLPFSNTNELFVYAASEPIQLLELTTNLIGQS
jgi:hypothetical protein